jgi:hypothetical protein
MSLLESSKYVNSSQLEATSEDSETLLVEHLRQSLFPKGAALRFRKQALILDMAFKSKA